MLSITKNKSKNSSATVKIIPRAKPKNVTNTVAPRATAPVVVPPMRNGGVQKYLTEKTFRQYLDGFVEILPKDLPMTVGGRLRYAIDTVRSNAVVSTVYRLGGTVGYVDKQLRYVSLFNPFSKARWNVQVSPPGKRVRLYYMQRGTSDEVAMIRALLTKMESNTTR